MTCGGTVSVRVRAVQCTGFTSVATGGHGWARAHPTSARVGREICTNSEFGGVRVGV